VVGKDGAVTVSRPSGRCCTSANQHTDIVADRDRRCCSAAMYKTTVMHSS
jgi:hypothetical protein